MEELLHTSTLSLKSNYFMQQTQKQFNLLSFKVFNEW